jgi:hypothetical protein
MITEKQYLKAKKVVADYESQQLNKPDVISSKPTSKKKKVIIDADNFSKMCDIIKRI